MPLLFFSSLSDPLVARKFDFQFMEPEVTSERVGLEKRSDNEQHLQKWQLSNAGANY